MFSRLIQRLMERRDRRRRCIARAVNAVCARSAVSADRAVSGRAVRASSAVSEALDPRLLLAYTYIFDSGTLYVDGSSAGDSITISASGGNVQINGANLFPNVTASSVNAIDVDGAAGGDTLNLSGVTTANGFTSNSLWGHVTISGGDGNDNITGSMFSESLFGGDGLDTIAAGAGDDVIYGGDDTDQLYGGPDYDRYVWNTFDSSAATDAIYEYSGEGTDTLDFTAYGNRIGVDLSSTSAQFVAYPAGGNLKIQINDGTTFENVNGSAFDDYIVGNSANNVLRGNAGNDLMYGGAGGDQHYGGAGNDTIYGQGDGDQLFGGDDSDDLYGGTGNDTYGWTNLLSGGDSDTDGLDEVFEYSGEGTDELHLIGYGNRVDIDLNSTAFRHLMGGTQGAVQIKFVNSQTIENIIGTYYDDVLVGNSLNNYIYAGSGNDHAYGGGGDDTLWGEDGSDVIYGGDGSDDMYGGAGDDTYMYTTNRTVVGERDYTGIDEIIEVSGQGSDWIFAVGYGNNIDIDLTSSAFRHLQGGTNGNVQLRFNNANTVENVYGTQFADIFRGTDAANIFFGTNGNDVAYGGGGADTLHGDNDDDILFGGDGSDDLYGGYGNDTFVWTSQRTGNENDVTGLDEVFESSGQGTDTLDFSAYGNNVDIDLTSTSFRYLQGGINGNIQLKLVNFETLENVYGTAQADIVRGSSAANFISLGAGNDTAYGGGGNDTIYGGEGNDLLFGDDNDDQLFGEGGTDTGYGGNGTDSFTNVEYAFDP